MAVCEVGDLNLRVMVRKGLQAKCLLFERGVHDGQSSTVLYVVGIMVAGSGLGK